MQLAALELECVKSTCSDIFVSITYVSGACVVNGVVHENGTSFPALDGCNTWYGTCTLSFVSSMLYSGTSDKIPSEIGITSLQRTRHHANTLVYYFTSEIGTTSLQGTKL